MMANPPMTPLWVHTTTLLQWLSPDSERGIMVTPSKSSRCTTRCLQKRNMVPTINVQLPLFFMLIVITCWPSTAGNKLPELKPYLWEHQHSFKALLQPRYFVMLQRSFKHDPGFLWDGRCIYGRMFEFYPEEKCSMGFVLAWSPSSNILVNRTVYTRVEATDGYPVGNAYTSSPVSVKTLALQYIFSASEYDNCDIQRVPHRNNGCEMYVLLDKINEVSSLCFFIYDLLCGPQRFIMYDQEECGNKTII